MADGKTLVIGTIAQQILTLDENTLAVTSHPVPQLGSVFALFYPNVVALANGKVLMIGQEEGIDSEDIQDGGQYLIEWDSTSNTFQEVEPAGGGQGWETDSLSRSADHKWAIFSADKFYLYSSDADSFTTASVTTVNPPQDEFGVRGYAMNADGTKIGVVSAQQATFLDRSFNVLATVQIPGAFQTGRTAVTFTSDGSSLLLQYDIPLAIEVLDANNYATLGYYSGAANAEDNDERLLAIDSSGRAFAGMGGGVRVIDMTKPIIANPSDDLLNGMSCPLTTTTAAPVNTAEQFSLGSPAPSEGTSYYFNGQPASLLSNGTQIDIPPSSTAGAADIECIGPDGNTFVYSGSFSYGVELIGVSANLLPPSGNPPVYIFGYGLSESPTISVGGKPVTNVFVSNPVVPLQVAQVRVPDGTSGQSSNVAVSSANGSGSITQAMTYIPSATIVPSSGLLQVLYDPHRDLLYALKATEVDVLNPTTLQWQSPLGIPGAGGSVSYNVMALSPDGAHLVVESPSNKVAVIDPDNPSQSSIVAINSDADGVSQPLVITKNNQALVVAPFEVPNNVIDLSTLSVTSFVSYLGQLVRASADGSALYGVDLNVTSGQLYAIDPTSFAVQSPLPFGQLFWTDLAVSSNGQQFAAIDGIPDTAGDIVGFFNASMNLLNFNVYPLVSPPDDVQVLGSTFSPGGKVLVVPLGDSIEFWDTATGTLCARLMTPEELNFLVYPEGPVAPQMALDGTGQTIFAISMSGLTVMKLSEPIDNLPLGPWAMSRRAAGQLHESSGGIAGRIRAMRKNHSKLKTPLGFSR